jgi:hypothetical protein
MTDDDGTGRGGLEPAEATVAGSGAVELAVIWATVDLDRTLRDLGTDSRPAAHDALLGARVAIVSSTTDGSRLAVAEPTAEGRLAAGLARNGEGAAGRYVAVADDLERARARAEASGMAVSRSRNGPFGPSLLVLSRPVAGPHLILCEATAVPSAP